MASGSFALTRTGSTSSYISFKCEWSSVANQSANTSTVTVKVTATKSSSSTASTYGNQETKVTVGSASQTVSGSFTLAPSKTITLFSKTFTVAHNNDGSKSVQISVNVGGNVIYANGSATVTLDKIPRYATVTQSLSSATETTATMKWTSDSVVDYIWYSTNNGSSWTGINVTDGKSGSYTISGLSANTKYNIKTRVRNKASQLTTDSSALAVTTYNYPYATTMPSFTIGERVTIGFYNPLGRTVTVNLIGADGSTLGTDTISGTSISGYNGSVVQGRMYASLPNAKSGKYQVRVTYGSSVITKTGGTYTVDASVCKPSIGGASYKDTNSSIVAITENDQLILQNKSVVEFTATGLTANNSASISSCSVTVNNQTYPLTVSGSTATGGNATIDSASDIEATITVTDSRGLTASKSVTLTMLELSNPSAIITMARQSNYYPETDITVDAKYSSVNGENTITISYACTKDGDAAPTVSGTLDDNVEATIVLDNDYAWTVVVTLVDRFENTTTYTLTLSRGMPIIYFDRLKSSVGINCFPQGVKTLEVNGINVFNATTRSIMTRSLSADTTNLTINTYTIIPLSVSNSVGDKLTATNDGGIKIGADVSKVLVSGRISLNCGATAGNRHLRIIKNTYSADNTLGWAWEKMEASASQNLTITPMIVDVQENDVIYLVYYVPVATDKMGGNAYGGRTSLTVETV